MLKLPHVSSTKLWCIKHHSPVVSLRRNCLRSTDALVSASHRVLRLKTWEYPQGIAVWGVTPPIYDTTEQATPAGLHVHLFDDNYHHGESTCETLYVKSRQKDNYLLMDPFAAATYMTSIVFDQTPITLVCVHCRQDHLDIGRKAVLPSRVHICNNRNAIFRTKEKCVSNPVMRIKYRLGDVAVHRPTIPSGRDLELSQKEFPGGIRIWGSNSAILWTVPRRQRRGIHVHCLDTDRQTPLIDQTVDKLTIDGVSLDADMVRHFMAQQMLPDTKVSLADLVCPECKGPHFDRALDALIPHSEHMCEHCGNLFRSDRNLVSNPLVTTLRVLYERR